MVWKACERFGILPPTVKNEWSENNEWNQALLLGFQQVREIEDNDREVAYFKALAGSR